VFAWFFLLALLLLLAARLRAIPSASHLRMFPSASLRVLSAHLSVPRPLLTHGMLAVSRASLLASFAGMHFSLVALKVLVVAGVFVPVFFGIHSFSLPAMFSHLPGLVLTLSCSSFASNANALSGVTLPCAFALAIVFSHIAWLLFTLSRFRPASFFAWPFTFSTCHTLSFRTRSFTFSTCHTLSFCASAFGFVE
jgi:hypothetical protein